MNVRTCFSFILTTATLAVALLAPLACPRLAAAQTNGYTVTDLGLISGATASEANAVNDNGFVVGKATIPSGKTNVYKGWLWTPSTPNGPSGSLRPLQPLGGQTHSVANDINNAGEIVGVCYSTVPSSTPSASPTATGHTATYWSAANNYTPMDFNSLPRDPALTDWRFTSTHSVSDSDPVAGTGGIYVFGSGRCVTGGVSTYEGKIVWRVNAGVIVGVTTLPDFGGLFNDMNNLGQVSASLVSGSGTSSVTHEAVVGDVVSGSSTTLGTLGGTNSYGQGINDYGTVVGYSNITAGHRAFVWTPAVPNGTEGTMVALGTLGGTRSFAYGINGAGQIVGRSDTIEDPQFLACLWQNGATTPTDLNTLKKAGATGLVLVHAYRINNRGGIIGWYSGRKGNRAFLLTPR